MGYICTRNVVAFFTFKIEISLQLSSEEEKVWSEPLGVGMVRRYTFYIYSYDVCTKSVNESVLFFENCELFSHLDAVCIGWRLDQPRDNCIVSIVYARSFL